MKAYYADSAIPAKYMELIADALPVSRCRIPCLDNRKGNAIAA